MRKAIKDQVEPVYRRRLRFTGTSDSLPLLPGVQLWQSTFFNERAGASGVLQGVFHDLWMPAWGYSPMRACAKGQASLFAEVECTADESWIIKLSARGRFAG